MEEATINARLPESLKRHGSEVLKRNGVSVSAAVRSLFEHLEKSQEIPAWMQAEENDVYQKRRSFAQSIAAAKPDSIPGNLDAREAFMRHELEKHGDRP